MLIPSQIKFIKGSDVPITVTLQKKTSGTPFSLAGYVSCSAKLLKTDGTYLTVAGSLQSSDLGQLLFSLSAANTASLQAGERMDMQVTFVLSSGTTILLLEAALNIVEALS